MANDTRCSNLSFVNPDSMITDNLQARLLLTAVFSLVTAMTVLGNFLVIAALIGVRFKCFAPKTNDSSNKTQYLIISMAVSDFVLGSMIMPFGIYSVVNNRRWELGSTLCNVREVFDIILSAVSFFHVACMAFDRYLAVCWPLLFRTLTQKTIFLMIGVCWIVPTAFVLAIVLSGWHTQGIEHIVLCSNLQKTCIFVHNKQSLLVIILVLLDCPLVATFVMYILVLREVKKYHRRKPEIYFRQEQPALQRKLKGITAHGKEISPIVRELKCNNKQLELAEYNAEMTEVLQCTHQSTGGYDSVDSDVCTYRQKRSIKTTVSRPRSNMKAVSTIGLIVVCLTICWLPINIVVLVSIFQDYTNVGLSLSVLWLAYTNSMINPVIYCHQRSIRSAMSSVLCPRRCCSIR